ncbi:DUF2927 domain-containing protein [Paracoccus pantotrophus]|uniref:DUF2927 domain-containing protein n=1 Tax=Paracoccus pantotrophus TaxID=82367 RepID=UPI000E09CBDA|nr:DUF2927 domain-containing protein [Paracoccus pantotrophus]RDD96733.1 DUF2927 domain-containing protein [Paracoccus pantotrophus]WGR66551.1 DUF2927 domain-containing protein [Paracoccus pantotrophus]
MTLPARSHLPLSAALAALALLAACTPEPPAEAPPPAVEAPPPPERPDPPVDLAALRRERAESARAAKARAEAAAASPASRNMRDYLAGVEQALIARGRLRTDSGDEIALTPEKLADTFIEVALYDEYVREGGKLVSRPTLAPLRRWQQPVALRLEFGDSVAPDQRARDRAEIAGFAARLARISGHPVALTGGAGNVTVLILNEDERRAIGPRLAALVPGIPPGDIAALRDLAPQNYCTVFAYSNGNSPVYAQAVALIRAELPPRMRRSCMHEELAQGMGLANDSPRARPSIFNDNEEFAYLTRHDELLLQILYDARLRPGMTEAEVRPIVLQIARELLDTEA